MGHVAAIIAFALFVGIGHRHKDRQGEFAGESHRHRLGGPPHPAKHNPFAVKG
jgi:hypothetical protein